MVNLLQHNENVTSRHSDSTAVDELSRAGRIAAAVLLGFILVLGFLGNSLGLPVFSRFPRLQTPASLLLMNISASDMLVSICGTPLSFAASVRGRWLTGFYGCQWYGFSNATFGKYCFSSVSLSLLSLERYSVLLCSSIQSSSSQYRRARLAVAASWFYSVVWTVPPLLGWSSYGPEVPSTTCSIQWHQCSAAARSYVSCLFVFCLLLPLLVMLFCYGRILLAARVAARQVTGINTTVLLTVVCMVTGYVLCWMPYGVVAMLSSFGRPGMVSPAARLIPSLLAKTSTVLNPFIYVLLNNQFSSHFLYMIRCSSEAPPTPVHHTMHSSTGAWPHNPKLSSEEPNTVPVTFTPRGQQIQVL
ncbi:pinopsin-like [Halichoeres trimaculatus]|uniref:pinopsin-like n=1 Tax=Halichoeres trimaculatus TaxID=147232 RepID=UPI003D9F5CCC